MRRSLKESFSYAFGGLIYSLKTQRNMKLHFLAGIVVLTLSLFLPFNGYDYLFVFFAVALVIIAEMINTAIEATVDLFTNDYHYLAKIAKDVAAGAVLLAAINSIGVLFLVIIPKVKGLSLLNLYRIRLYPYHILLLITGLLFLIYTFISYGRSQGGRRHF